MDNMTNLQQISALMQQLEADKKNKALYHRIVGKLAEMARIEDEIYFVAKRGSSDAVLIEDYDAKFLLLFTSEDKADKYAREESCHCLSASVGSLFNDLLLNREIEGFNIDRDDIGVIVEAKHLVQAIFGSYNHLVMPKKDWGEGIPNYKDADLLNQMQIDDFCIQIVGQQAKKEGYEVLYANNDYEISPVNLVMTKDDELFFTFVKGAVAPNMPTLTKEQRREYIEYSDIFYATPYFAPVGIGACDPERFDASIALKGDAYYANFVGYETIEETFDFENGEEQIENNTAENEEEKSSLTKCDDCGKELPDDSIFCMYCGSKNVSRYTKETKVVKKCSKCGKELPEDSVFCMYCGGKAIEEQIENFVKEETVKEEPVKTEETIKQEAKPKNENGKYYIGRRLKSYPELLRENEKFKKDYDDIKQRLDIDHKLAEDRLVAIYSIDPEDIDYGFELYLDFADKMDTDFGIHYIDNLKKMFDVLREREFQKRKKEKGALGFLYKGNDIIPESISISIIPIMEKGLELLDKKAGERIEILDIRVGKLIESGQYNTAKSEITNFVKNNTSAFPRLIKWINEGQLKNIDDYDFKTSLFSYIAENSDGNCRYDAKKSEWLSILRKYKNEGNKFKYTGAFRKFTKNALELIEVGFDVFIEEYQDIVTWIDKVGFEIDILDNLLEGASKCNARKFYNKVSKFKEDHYYRRTGDSWKRK